MPDTVINGNNDCYILLQVNCNENWKRKSDPVLPSILKTFLLFWTKNWASGEKFDKFAIS